MPRFSANLTMMFNEWSSLDRFAAAADAGFTAVEYLFPYDHKLDEIADRLARNHLVQILHGDVTIALRTLFPLIPHIQIASVPSRHEPDREELRYDFLFEELDKFGYDGFVGCEYRPRTHTLDGLGWFAPYASSGLQRSVNRS